MLSEKCKVYKSIILVKMSYRPEIRIFVRFMKHLHSRHCLLYYSQIRNAHLVYSSSVQNFNGNMSAR
jgi:hypothetical protein